MSIAAILVGGKGTRLRPAISDVPKPLAPINGEPFLYLLLRELKKAGFDQIILLTGYGHEQIQNACGDGSQFDLQIFYSREIEPLGTGGAICHAKKFLNGHNDFLLLNGDTYLDCSLKNLVDYQFTTELLGVIGVLEPEDTSRYGTIQFDSSTQQIQAFREKDPSICKGFVNAGIYKLSTKIIDYIPENQFVSLEQDIFPMLIKEGHLFKALPLQGMFYDIGLPESYAAFNANYTLNASVLSPLARSVLFALVSGGKFWLVAATTDQQIVVDFEEFLVDSMKAKVMKIAASGLSALQSQIDAKDFVFIIKDNEHADVEAGINAAICYMTGSKEEIQNQALTIKESDLKYVKQAWANLRASLQYLDVTAFYKQHSHLKNMDE